MEAPTKLAGDLPQLLQALRAGRVAEAGQACEAALRQSPRDPALHQMAALIALTAGSAGDAHRWATSCLALRPDHVPALVIAGCAARRLGDLAGARAMIGRACTLAPDRGEPAFLLRTLLLERGSGDASGKRNEL